MMIHPIQGRLLVELRDKYKNFAATEERFGNSKTQGVIVAVAPDLQEKAAELGLTLGRTAYFGMYEDTAPYTVNDKKYALIKIEEVGGWSDDVS